MPPNHRWRSNVPPQTAGPQFETDHAQVGKAVSRLGLPWQGIFVSDLIGRRDFRIAGLAFTGR